MTRRQRWKRRTLLVVALASIACGFAPEAGEKKSSPDELRVELKRATLPQPLTVLAVHYCFIVKTPGKPPVRWEVWQSKDAGGTSFGHVHEDLMGETGTVGGGPIVLERTFTGDEAKRIREALSRTPREYPWRERYLAWPGPNSNTFAAWVLREAGVSHNLHPKAIGKDYLGTPGTVALLGVGVGVTAGGTGAQIETPVVGLALGAREGVEVHVLCLTLGFNVYPPALVTPFGRIGGD